MQSSCLYVEHSGSVLNAGFNPGFCRQTEYSSAAAEKIKNKVSVFTWFKAKIQLIILMLLNKNWTYSIKNSLEMSGD